MPARRREDGIETVAKLVGDRRRLHRSGENAINGVIHTVARLEAGIGKSRRRQPRHAPAGININVGKTAAHKNSLIDIQGHREDVAVRPRAERIERCVHRAIHVQTREPVERHAIHGREGTRDEHLVEVRAAGVCVNHQAVNAVIDPVAEAREGGVHRPRGCQPHHAVEVLRVEGGEVARRHHAAIGQQAQRLDRLVRCVTRIHARTGIKGGVQGSRGGHPGNAVATDTGVGTETTADEDGPIWLHHHRVDEVVRPGSGIERGVQLASLKVNAAYQARNRIHGRSAGQNPGNPVPRRGVVGGEVTHNHRLLVRLHGDGKHHIVRPGGRIEWRHSQAVIGQVPGVVQCPGRLLLAKNIILDDGQNCSAQGTNRIAKSIGGQRRIG